MPGSRVPRRTGSGIALAIAGIAAGSAVAAGIRRRRLAARPSTEEVNKDVVRRLLEEPWSGNLDAIGECVAPGYVGYDPTEPEPIRGPDSVRAGVVRWVGAFPGAMVTIENQVAEGDCVATRWIWRGVQTGEIAGIAPTGKEVTVAATTFSRLENGKVVEQWTSWDALGLLVQLGAVPTPTTA